MAEAVVQFKDYALLIVAVVGVSIAWGQWSTARTKLILDPYDKRRAVYSKFHGPIGEAVRAGRSDMANYINYITVLDEARFLFGRDVLEYTEQIKLTLNKLNLASTMLRDDGGHHLSEEERMKFVKSANACMSELADFWKKLDKLMVPYMLMEQKRPWSVSRVTGFVAQHLRHLR